MENKDLFQPLEFWSDKVKLLDDRVRLLANTFGFGKVGLELIVRHGKVIDVTFTEVVTVRQKENDGGTQETEAHASK
jgi:hypothetical protein